MIQYGFEVFWVQGWWMWKMTSADLNDLGWTRNKPGMNLDSSLQLDRNENTEIEVI